MAGPGGDGFSEANQPTPPAELSNQLDIFHDGNFRKAADSLEISAAHENRLVTIRKAETSSPLVGSESNQPQAPSGRGDHESKRAPHDLRISESLLDCLCGSRTELAVRVEKEQHISTRGSGSEIHLDAATGCTRDHPRTTPGCNLGGSILALAVRDDDLGPGRDGRKDSRKARFLVQGRDDDGKPHVAES